ncbi:putative trimethyllysine dioxygenase [[Candida] jaroonii]|uniref:Trimethyllysine dioxygenase n=1 Tax=[Candida] jaroonii TaxID=467808 RepID=A0ACA9Y6S6_9ASCO|nr:putative trimethyllysine dioxygenase [[Candida] jaroonii]
MSATVNHLEIHVTFEDGNQSTYHNIWLRDNCHCDKCYYSITKQRLLNSATINDDIKPKDLKVENGKISIVWDQDDHESEYAFDWLYLHSYNPVLVPMDEKVKGEKETLKMKYWAVKDIANDLPTVDFNKVMNSSDETDGEEAIKDWCLKIWQNGFCLIDNVPVTPEDTEKLCEKLMFIRPTHYGGFWDFTSDLSKNDTAYTNFDISSHTDGTYWSDTPGLQLFHLLFHDGEGGTSSLVDAFRCAQILKETHPESFDLLTKIPIPAHSAGEEKVCIQPDIPQPVFKLDNEGQLIQVRWNQSDRSTMNNWSNPQDVPKFYKAIKHWYSIISDKENEFFYQLKPGQCLIFDNWRCFHSRTEFTGKRRLCGAYINRDDFVSRLKLLNVGRQYVLDSI